MNIELSSAMMNKAIANRLPHRNRLGGLNKVDFWIKRGDVNEAANAAWELYKRPLTVDELALAEKNMIHNLAMDLDADGDDYIYELVSPAIIDGYVTEKMFDNKKLKRIRF